MCFMVTVKLHTQLSWQDPIRIRKTRNLTSLEAIQLKPSATRKVERWLPESIRSGTIVWLTTEANDQSSLRRAIRDSQNISKNTPVLQFN